MDNVKYRFGIRHLGYYIVRIHCRKTPIREVRDIRDIRDIRDVRDITL